MIKKFLAAVIAAVCAVTFTACADKGNEWNTSTEQSDSQIVLPVKEKGIMDDSVKNFWQTDTMIDETVIFVAETDDYGNVISTPKAKLLYEPLEIISVKQYFHQDNAGETVTYRDGKDYVYEGGYIKAAGRSVKNPITEKTVFETRVPYGTDRQMSGEDAFPNISRNESIPSTDAGLYLPFTESFQIVQMQLSVTYRHAAEWGATTPAYFGESALERSVAKLKNEEKTELFVFGDSISTGANSSSVLNISPYLKTWPELVADNLASYYGAEVTLANRSVGGWTSENAVRGGSGWMHGVQITQPGISGLFKGELAGYSPDIVIIGFGMNDATLGVSPDDFCNNIMTMINTVRSANADCDIILLGTMLANPKALNQSKNQAQFNGYLKNVAALYDGVAVVDVGAMHADILAKGKNFTEISANNVNHPNDFMARVYAMNILSAFIK
ncbi:MAG: SGNH/GDSL hydrolase family protein [Clostridia bacterium]|nr:SGNH/GDSL hydrolase family protein [Clostridia bacterium]